METFEPGIASAYNTHTFRIDEEGMKCLACPKVMTMAEWAEKRRCFCQSTNAVRAIARSTPPTRLETNRRTGINSSNTRSNTPPTNLPALTPNSHSTISNASSSSRNTTSYNSNFTNYSVSSHTENNSSSSGWGCAAIICILLGIGSYITQFGSFSRNNIIQSSQPQLTPKEVITKYYQLAPSNPEAARGLVSDTLKKYWKEKNQKKKTKYSFNQFHKIDVYSFETLTESSTSSKIKVLLKYINNNKATCESQIIELIFDQSKGQWLIHKVYDVKYNQKCGK